MKRFDSFLDNVRHKMYWDGIPVINRARDTKTIQAMTPMNNEALALLASNEDLTNTAAP